MVRELGDRSWDCAAGQCAAGQCAAGHCAAGHCPAGHCPALPCIAAAAKVGGCLAHDVSHFLKYTFTCSYCLTPSSFPPSWKTIPPQQLVSQAPALDPDITDDISFFITVTVMRPISGLESASDLVDVPVNIDRSAKLILKPLKTKYFLISIQVFLVFFQLQLSWSNSLNKKRFVWLIFWCIKAKQNNLGIRCTLPAQWVWGKQVCFCLSPVLEEEE